MNNDLWVGAATALLGAGLGGVISLALNRQQMKDARAQRTEEALRQQHGRSVERRFEAYSDFLTRVRSFRNALRAFCLLADPRPTISQLDDLMRSANDASALVYLVVEATRTYNACRAMLHVMSDTQIVIHGVGSRSPEALWPELHERIGHAMREFQNAARTELGVGGPERPWGEPQADESAHPDRAVPPTQPDSSPTSGTPAPGTL